MVEYMKENYRALKNHVSKDIDSIMWKNRTY